MISQHTGTAFSSSQPKSETGMVMSRDGKLLINSVISTDINN